MISAPWPKRWSGTLPARACYGELAERLRDLLAERSPEFRCSAVADLSAALAWCWERSAPGDTILLSPAFASLDQFRDFEHRAEVFRQLVEALGP